MNGFTLIEAVVALAVVSLVAIAVLGQVSASTRAQTDASEHVVAAALSEQRLEVLRLLDGDELTRLPDSLREGRFDPPLDAYAWNAAADRLRDQPDLVDVRVTISWESGSHPLRTHWYRP